MIANQNMKITAATRTAQIKQMLAGNLVPNLPSGCSLLLALTTQHIIATKEIKVTPSRPVKKIFHYDFRITITAQMCA
jgi:hypothetical protein